MSRPKPAAHRYSTVFPEPAAVYRDFYHSEAFSGRSPYILISIMKMGGNDRNPSHFSQYRED